ncbi:MAG: UDP-3-O-acyl-N-acetylglucosamine deacetylase [Planctomycetota bacterium]
MKTLFRHTIKKQVSCEGTGLFTGQKAILTFLPAKIDSGVTFIVNNTRIPATLQNVLPQYRRNAIGKDGIVIETIEHLMAALNGLSITNIDIEIAGSNGSKSVEVPNTDGSAQFFVELLSAAGIEEQRVPKKVLRIKAPVDYKDGECSITALPDNNDYLTIDYTFSHPARIIGNQHLSIKITEDNFISEIAPARTFCMADEVASLQAQGIGRSANYQNVLVVDNDKIIDNNLRFKDEFVRHKILDLMGDLYLLNAPVFAKIIAVKTGHKQNIEFVRRLAQDQQ